MKKNEISSWLDLKHNNYSPGEIFELTVLSGSMYPLLIPGKKIRIKTIAVKDINRGDIILFKKNNQLIAHRILFYLTLKKKYFLQKGDQNRFASFTNEDNVIGLVIESQISTGDYLNLQTTEEKAKAALKAKKEFKKFVLNVILYIPRIIKNALST